MNEALSWIRPPREQAAEVPPESVQRQARERLSQTTEESPAPEQTESHSDSYAVSVTAAGRGQVSHRRVEKLRCSFCRVDLDGSLELTIAGKHGQTKSTGSFCSTHCRNCVLALAALHPSPLAPDDFISTRGLLSDRLLDLWRHGRGPDPLLVLRAAERAGSGLPNADSAVLTDVQVGGQALSLTNLASLPAA